MGERSFSAGRRLIRRGLISVIGGVLLTVLVSWWLEMAPEHPLLCYPASWYEFDKDLPSIRNSNEDREPHHNLALNIRPWPTGDDDSRRYHVITLWGGSRAGRTVVQTEIIPDFEEYPTSIDIERKFHGEWSSRSLLDVDAIERRNIPVVFIGPKLIDEVFQSRLSEFQADSEPLSYLVIIMEFHTGWPMRSMALAYYLDPVTLEYPTIAAWPVPARVSDFIGSQTERLPLRPLPLGFAVNTLFYAALILIPWELLAWARRARRRSRGLCARCAHSLAGLPDAAPCPECGTMPKQRPTPNHKPSAQAEGGA